MHKQRSRNRLFRERSFLSAAEFIDVAIIAALEHFDRLIATKHANNLGGFVLFEVFVDVEEM